MQTEAPPRRPLLRRVAAFVILLAALAIGIHIVIGLVMTIVWVAIAAVVAVAVLWALKTIVW